jgi:hypothetical protein
MIDLDKMKAAIASLPKALPEKQVYISRDVVEKLKEEGKWTFAEISGTWASPRLYGLKVNIVEGHNVLEVK